MTNARALTLAIVAVLGAREAHADGRDPVAATELFEKGRRAAEGGDYATACPSFAESFHLDPKVGSVLNLADCEEHLNQLANAHAHWLQGADLARAQSDPRDAYARDRLAQLDKRVPRLRIVLGPGAPAGTTVSRDGVDLGVASYGVALPVDPGAHAIVVDAPHHASSRVEVTLVEGQSLTETVAVGAPILVVPALPETAPPTPPPEQGLPVQRWVAIGVGTAGLVALGAGSVIGLHAKSVANGAACDANDACTAQGISQRDDAYRSGNVATVLFTAGAAALVGAVVVWFTTPHADTRSVTTSAGPAGASPALRF